MEASVDDARLRMLVSDSALARSALEMAALRMRAHTDTIAKNMIASMIVE
jgi:hypothetical protein